jgi:S-adenosylmethionine:tRNA ribosyltransferase-isomerase
MRAVESSVSSHGTLNPLMVGQIVFPPHEFTIPTCMITNFHTPKSTLLMMVSAFCGHDLMKRAYEEAIKEEYKFYSYGDAMLII